ncbi:uncharacterized protein A4U43_C05F22460 [Asparagus officinalis]|uniref:BHLH domain-containing protein n=2 Tax=Asparagus officinalis TaxID=4686 RepID=A0A5P1EZ18_ASPOF|nr:uncharacterized protein A4U43_C05F22460 [Asparagus officinalis]
MVDSFSSPLYNQQANPQISVGKSLPMSWNPSVLPPGLPNFPADSGFIERAVRFSCFNGGNFSSMVNSPFAPSEQLSPYASKGPSESPSPINDDQRDNKRVSDEAGEVEFSGDVQKNSSSIGNAAKKSKKSNLDMELDQVQGVDATKENLESKQKGEQNSSTGAATKSSGKNAKDGANGAKEDYIHIRARRGQATNSHSLAERVRREKISERMKFLQELVPGCSKVTGKAVMLDEIINYVQSLQRQVEFLSMKLAAVNPRLDVNIESLLSKDLLQLRGGSSSAIGFLPEMIHPQSHNAQQDLLQAGIAGMGNPSDTIRRALNAQLTSMSGFKEPLHQMPNSWEDELHNIVQMNFSSNPAFNPQDSNAKPQNY